MFKRIQVTEKIYNRFIDTGKVPDDIIRLLAFKIIKGDELNSMELSIFYNKTAEINEMIRIVRKK